MVSLIIGDILVFLIFVIIGRSNHTLSLTDLGAIVTTAAPFGLAWFLVAPWFGLFRAEVRGNWQKVVPRLLLAWVLVGGPLSLIFWALLRGRTIPGGIIPTFAIVTLVSTTLFLLIWRVGYAWWAKRQNPHNTFLGA